jgi:hypothetical protein
MDILYLNKAANYTVGCGLVNGFIDHLYTQLATASNYGSIAILHTLQITTAPAKPFSSLLFLHKPLFIGPLHSKSCTPKTTLRTSIA